MLEKEAVRDLEAEASGDSMYELLFKIRDEARNRIKQGRYVIKGKQVPFRMERQGYIRTYLHPRLTKDAVLNIMMSFIHEIRGHSGRHTHQGGTCLFIPQGKGHTTVDGVPHDWEAGDLILLPMRPGGVSHQHFNDNPDGPSRFLCMSPWMLKELAGRTTEQDEVLTDWAEKQEGREHA